MEVDCPLVSQLSLSVYHHLPNPLHTRYLLPFATYLLTDIEPNINPANLLRRCKSLEDTTF